MKGARSRGGPSEASIPQTLSSTSATATADGRRRYESRSARHQRIVQSQCQLEPAPCPEKIGNERLEREVLPCCECVVLTTASMSVCLDGQSMSLTSAATRSFGIKNAQRCKPPKVAPLHDPGMWAGRTKVRYRIDHTLPAHLMDMMLQLASW